MVKKSIFDNFALVVRKLKFEVGSSYECTGDNVTHCLEVGTQLHTQFREIKIIFYYLMAFS